VGGKAKAMKTIHKFKLKREPEQEFETAKVEQIIELALQDGVICVWALVDETVTELTKFRVYGTGNVIEDDIVEYSSIGAVHEESVLGPRVWHVFWYNPDEVESE
jgi:hypothetical protein